MNPFFQERNKQGRPALWEYVAAILLWVFFFVLLAFSARGQTLSIEREDFYIVLSVSSTQAMDVQTSTDLTTWNTVDLVHFYEGYGAQTNFATILDSGSRFFRLKDAPTNGSLYVITRTNPPAMDFIAYGAPGERTVYRNACLSAAAQYRIGAGTWQLEHNHDLRGARQTHPTCIEGDIWRRVSPVLTGPASGTLNLALPAATPGFLRLRRL